MITAAKKIRARSGSTLMFATVDVLEGAVELMVFEKTLAAAEAALQLDEIVLVKGRVDHKEGGKVCVIVQEVERFDPSDAEIAKARAQAVKAAEPPKPLRFEVDGARLPVTVIEDLKRLCEDYPGDCDFVLEVRTPDGVRRLRFGANYRVAARNASLKAELDRLLAPARPLALV
jgi:DNA polymerase III subunit alpha